MSYKSLTETLTLYRSGTLTLGQASNREGISSAKLVSELKSRGIPVREEAQTETTIREKSRAETIERTRR